MAPSERARSTACSTSASASRTSLSSPTVCTNTERADVDITIEAGRGKSRRIERHWHLTGTGHSEVGLRGDDAPAADEKRPKASEQEDDR